MLKKVKWLRTTKSQVKIPMEVKKTPGDFFLSVELLGTYASER